MNISRYIALPQAARTARVARRALLAAIRRHELPAKLHLNRWWITPAPLAAWRLARRLKTPCHVAPGSTIRPPDVSRDGGRAA